MRHNKLAIFVSCVLLLSACTTATPAYKDNGPRTGSYVQGEPDNVAQQFYDYRIQHRDNSITALHLYLGDKLTALLSDAGRDNSHHELLDNGPFSSRTALSDSVHVANASTIPSRGACSIPLHVDLKRGDRSWQDEALMIQEGQCQVIDDVHYLGGSVHVTVGTLRQSIENH